jgi:parallel beta-helix repeat protein
MTKFFRPTFFVVFAIVIGAFIFSPSAQAATSTVCASGCDFTSLEDAITADVPGQDTLVLANGYDAAAETVYLYLPEETLLTCDPGVVFGVGGSTHYVYSNNNVIVQDCTFEEARFIADNLSNNVWRNNVWTDSSSISSINSDGLTISGNQGTLNVYLQDADNIVIRDNEIDSYYGSLLIRTSSDITVNNNIFTNNEPTYISSSWASFNEVTNLEFTSNTLRSVPITGSHFMMHVSGIGDIIIRENLFLYPEDISVINGGIKGLALSNLYPQNDDVHFVIENNNFISHQPVAPNALTYACAEIGYGGNPGDTGHMFVQYNYNLCSLVGAQDSSVAAGIGLRTDSSLVNNLTLTDEYNGFFGMQYPVADYDNTNYVYLPSATLLNANTQYRKPVFRDENIDISDDYELVPMSTYLDVNGTRDVGVFAGGPRIASYTIDDDCVVDYATCHSQTTEILSDVLMNGHTVTTAPGTYSGATITGPLSNITIQGAGVYRRLLYREW